MTRVTVTPGGGLYFKPSTEVRFIPSGCKLLDLALGGGWAEGRVINVIGDKASGKTLLAIEACANFQKKYPAGLIFYRETEAALDVDYAHHLGLPRTVDFGQALHTVEDIYEDFMKCVERSEKPQLYIIDSLDALSDRAELDRDIDEGTYGMQKAKLLTQIFRRIIQAVETSQSTLMIISQIRDNISPMPFVKKWRRGGGHALDFYSSQTLFLAETGKIYKTVMGIKRPIGVEIKAKLDKNKVGIPYREAAFDIIFGYGIDDVNASISFLKSIKKLPEPVPEEAELHKLVEHHWYRIEEQFTRKDRKYE